VCFFKGRFNKAANAGVPGKTIIAGCIPMFSFIEIADTICILEKDCRGEYTILHKAVQGSKPEVVQKLQDEFKGCFPCSLCP
jgi:hypothetical protein